MKIATCRNETPAHSRGYLLLYTRRQAPVTLRLRLALAAAAFFVCALVGTVICLVTHPSIHRVSAAPTLLADGRHHQLATVAARWNLPLRAEALTSPTADFEQLTPTLVGVYVRTPVNPGTLRVNIAAPGNHLTFATRLQPDEADTFDDGTPDFLRLHTAEDRAAFRRWFTTLAERAADMPGAQLAQDLPEITDCASLLRYSYRESLRAHDDRWYAQFPMQNQPPTLPSVQQWSYPNTPLGVGLFRVHPGAFTSTSSGGNAFAQFADAKTLYTLNAHRIARDLHNARAGDLIFYRLLEADSQYHSMILTGTKAEWVVYHTGPIGKHRGEMRRVLLSDLLHHPDPRWRPTPQNPNFLGVYRWNILREP